MRADVKRLGWTLAVVAMLASAAAAAREAAPARQPVCRSCETTGAQTSSRAPVFDPKTITTLEGGILDIRRPERSIRDARGVPPWESATRRAR